MFRFDQGLPNFWPIIAIFGLHVSNASSFNFSRGAMRISSGTSSLRDLRSPLKSMNIFSHSTKSEVYVKKQETGLAHFLLQRAIDSPLWKYFLAPQAKAKMLSTAEANGVPWSEALQWIQKQDGPWKEKNGNIQQTTSFPTYYTQKFHAYEDGNLSWEAAFEQEIVGRAVGARNFPAYKDEGDLAFRTAFQAAFDSMNVSVPDDGVIVDMACGTGTSTRNLAKRWKNARQIIGLDMSPYFIGVGQRLLEICPKSYKEGGPWVCTVEKDDRIELQVGDATDTRLPDNFSDAVNVQFLFHEMPIEKSIAVCREAFRILKPGGQMWIGEMDFQAPAYAAQRANVLLFSLIRATEPYLDDYADGIPEIISELTMLFEQVEIKGATGRHFAIVAKKSTSGAKTESGSLIDKRFNEDGSYSVQDTHLNFWEVKK